MKISPYWLRDFVDLPVDYTRLADELTLAGVAVEGISGEGDSTVFEMEITTNRPDVMNHYGVAREASALYDLPLKRIEPVLTAAAKASSENGALDAVLKRSSTQNQSSSGTTEVTPSRTVASRAVPFPAVPSP